MRFIFPILLIISINVSGQITQEMYILGHRHKVSATLTLNSDSLFELVDYSILFNTNLVGNYKLFHDTLILFYEYKPANNISSSTKKDHNISGTKDLLFKGILFNIYSGSFISTSYEILDSLKVFQNGSIISPTKSDRSYTFSQSYYDSILIYPKYYDKQKSIRISTMCCNYNIFNIVLPNLKFIKRENHISDISKRKIKLIKNVP